MIILALLWAYSTYFPLNELKSCDYYVTKLKVQFTYKTSGLLLYPSTVDIKQYTSEYRPNHVYLFLLIIYSKKILRTRKKYLCFC